MEFVLTFAIHNLRFHVYFSFQPNCFHALLPALKIYTHSCAVCHLFSSHSCTNYHLFSLVVRFNSGVTNGFGFAFILNLLIGACSLRIPT